MRRHRKISFGFIAPLMVFAAAAFAGEAPGKSPATSSSIGQVTASDQSGGGRANASKHVEDEIFVRFKDGATELGKASAHSLAGGTTLKKFDIVKNLELVKLPPGLSVKEAIKLYQAHPDVLYAEPNYVVEALALPNDPFFNQLWGLQNTGQSGGTVDADIDATDAWNITTGSSSVVVAVIDTGVDYTHEDLAANIWNNPLDCNNNGIDDDGNGYIDDCHGIDVVNNDSDPMDDHNHGTHVSGTIGGVGNNSVGVTGVNWNVNIMACKFLNSGGSGTTDGAVTCLNYVALMKDRGVNIIATSNSWGGGGYSQALYDAIDAHRQRGILFIAAAGNSSLDNDSNPFYPARYYLPNLIAVAATDRFDARAYFSNYGRRTVHLGAPGQDILSTTIGNTYSTFSGTSMATPHVTGTAALLKAQDGTRDWRAIKNLILAGGDSISSMTNTISQKRLNANGALTCSNSTVTSRLRPLSDNIATSAGTPIDLAVLNINCASPNGNVTVTVNPGGQVINLLDDGAGADQAAGDGIYSGQFTPSGGSYTLTFSTGDVVNVYVLQNYTVQSAPFNYRTITGTNLNFGDDSVASISSPFPILFGGGSFNALDVSNNGNISFTALFSQYINSAMPTSQIDTLVAPFWDDLYSLSGTSQNVFWAVNGSAPNRELVIEWRDVRNFTCNTDGTATVKFQVVFFEGLSDILFNYADTVFGGSCAFADHGASATVGVQVGSTVGTQFSFNSSSLSDNSSLLWTLAGPVLSVTPSSQDFGTVLVGSSADRDFTVQNSGGGTLSGSASTSDPFSIVSGGSYSLGGGQSQTVTVRFSPNGTGTFNGNVSFTGGSGASRTVTGIGATQFTLTVNKSGTGSGTVSGPGISCGLDCTEDFTSGTVVSLTAAPASDSVFAGWSGACSGTGSCSVTMDAAKSVTATFNKRINVTSPNGGEIWLHGTTQSIKWTSSGVTGKVNISLSRNGGSTWTTLFSNVPNNGSKSWKVTTPATNQARIRVCSASSPSLCDTSDGNFTIQ